MKNPVINKMRLPREVTDIINAVAEVIVPESREHLFELSFGGKGNKTYDVCFDVNGKSVREAYVTSCKNGMVVNFDDKAMRRRDPNSMVIADSHPTDKPRYEEKYGEPFDKTRQETFDWLKERESLIVLPFYAGNADLKLGYPCIALVPANAACFAAMLADMQCRGDCRKFIVYTDPSNISKVVGQKKENKVEIASDNIRVKRKAPISAVGIKYKDPAPKEKPKAQSQSNKNHSGKNYQNKNHNKNHKKIKK